MREFRFLLIAALLAVPSASVAAEAPARLGFADAVKLGAGESPNTQLAEWRERGARARVGSARSALLPQLSAGASMAERTFSLQALGIQFPALPGQAPFADLQGPVQVVDARLRLAQPVVDLAAWQKLRAADLGAQVARSERAAANEAGAAQAAAAYLNAARAEASLAARADELQLAKELLGLAELQLQAGTALGIDATRARTQVASSQGAMLVARNQRDRAFVDLARAIGVEPSTRYQLADTLSASLGASDAPEDDAALAFALDHRVDLRGQQGRLAQARTDRAAIEMERLPRVDAAADWGASGRHPSDAIATYQVSIAASMPLFDGLRRESRLAEQRSAIEQANVRERDLEDQVRAEVLDALLGLASGREQLAVAMEQVSLANQELAQARERFSNGVAGNIEIINAQSSLVRARDAEIEARYAVASARVALARATGAARTLR
jgi:outer membrane protein TolC